LAAQAEPYRFALSLFPGLSVKFLILFFQISHSIFPLTQGFQLFLADRVVSLEHVHGFVAACRHDPEEVMSLEPPVIDCRMPQIVEGKVFNCSLFSRILKCPLMFPC